MATTKKTRREVANGLMYPDTVYVEEIMERAGIIGAEYGDRTDLAAKGYSRATSRRNFIALMPYLVCGILGPAAAFGMMMLNAALGGAFDQIAAAMTGASLLCILYVAYHVLVLGPERLRSRIEVLAYEQTYTWAQLNPEEAAALEAAKAKAKEPVKAAS
jgi:hypothetical protein